jgi:hypothetical protein
MSKIKKFAAVNIRKIVGGKDPLRLVEDFILRLGFDPDECSKEKTPDNARWMVTLPSTEDMEILLEGLKKPSETTIYMGINVVTVPLRGAHDLLIAALEIADGLVGIKVSLFGHYIVLSASLPAAGLSVEDLEYAHKLIAAQEQWFKQTLCDELGVEELPEG